MNIRTLHKIIGLLLFVPLVIWAMTGAVFLIKPGYEQAYEKLVVKTYPLNRAVKLEPMPQWHQVRMLKTVLGHHLLVNDGKQWQHYDPVTLVPKKEPSADRIKLLVADAITANADRYGSIASVNDMTALTETDVEISLDWNTLSLRQRGPDTRLIGKLYDIHYLQWSGVPGLDKVLGVTGLVFLLLLTTFGLIAYIKRPQDDSD